MNCSAPSPCINAGEEYVEVDGVIFYAPLTDLDGEERPLGEVWDVGVDEEAICTFIPEEENRITSTDLTLSPNPSSGLLNITYKVSEPGYVNIYVLSMQGELLETLSPGMQNQGEYSLNLDLSQLPDGLYLIRLQAGNQVETIKVVLLK